MLMCIFDVKRGLVCAINSVESVEFLPFVSTVKKVKNLWLEWLSDYVNVKSY